MSWQGMSWLYRNLQTLIIAFLLAVVVWISAITSSDPNLERSFRTVPLEVIGKSEDLMIMSKLPDTIALTIYAPQSRLEMIDQDSRLIKATLDITGLSYGIYTIPVNVKLEVEPARLVRQDPQTIDITLDRLINRDFNLNLSITGKLAIGYEAGPPKVDDEKITVSGPESLVNKVKEIRADVDLAGRSDNLETTIIPQALDINGIIVSGVTISPAKVKYVQPITLQNGYQTKVVRVVTTGNVADGYRLNDILVYPLRLLLFTPDPQLYDEIPGYIETEPLDLKKADKDFESRLALKLPEGISIVGDQTVLARVSVAAIESSLSMKLPLEIIGLEPQKQAILPLESVDVLLAGPLPILSTLNEKDVRALLDLSDLDIGKQQVTPRMDILPEDVRVLSISPPNVEVTIEERKEPLINGTPSNKHTTPQAEQSSKEKKDTPTRTVTPVPPTKIPTGTFTP